MDRVPVIEHKGVSYDGCRSIAEIFAEIRRQAEAYKDYILPLSSLRLVVEPAGIRLELQLPAGPQRLPMTRHTILQLCNWIGLPANSRLFKALRTGTTGDRPVKDPTRFWQTWCDLFNSFFTKIQGRKLIRALLDHNNEWFIRAFLSDHYMIIPNDQLFLAVSDALERQLAEPWNARLSEDSFYLYAIAPGITAQVRKDRPFANGSRWLGHKDDVVNAALMLRNSETGQGGCEVCPAIVHEITGTYFVKHNALSRRHIGKRHEMDGLLSKETLKKRASLIFDEVRDYVKAVFNEDMFQAFVDKLNGATQDEMEDPVTAAEAVRATYSLSEHRKDAILRWLMKTGDYSRYGLATAVGTEARCNAGLAPDEAVALERVATDLVENQTMLKLSRNLKHVAEKEAAKALTAKNQAISASALDL